ncbi:tetratricopeptide repeat protein [Candidatus Pelagibacter communis]|uniref:tetratricopeptide repeat protein n=1 Tax=Pelagibacter ubique TaxID=198252 RepID=UPI00094CCFBB|nr:tetratricopeptide repeat protein [Candidatus Pelagibacter ubique]
MIKFFKIITLISFIIYPNISFGNENYFNEGVKLFEKKRYEDAKFLLQRSIVFDPKHADSYLYLAKIYKEKDDQKNEEKNLETTLLIDPVNEEAILMLMEIGIKKTNYSKVKELSERFTKVCKNLCTKNKKIIEDLNNLEPENES